MVLRRVIKTYDVGLASELQSGSTRETKIESLVIFPYSVRDKSMEPTVTTECFYKCQLAIGVKSKAIFSLFSSRKYCTLIQETNILIYRVDSGSIDFFKSLL